MIIDKETAMKVWNDFFGDKEWVQDCFGTWMNKNAYSNEKVLLIRPGNTEKYDYSWNIDHIRPKATYDNEDEADFYNNLEPMQRQNNLSKSDDYPIFTINEKKYKVVKCEGKKAYGIVNDKGERIDWKGVNNRYYK